MDPTLDIVRQLIVEAEAAPAPAPKPSGPPTPRPETAEPAPQPAAAPPPVPDAAPEVWEDDPEPDSWDDMYMDGGVRSYGIVDPETGETVTPDGTGAGAAVADPVAAPPARPRERVLLTWLGAVVRAVGRLLGRVLRAFGRWIGALIAAVAARVARFLRRPDAPRRLAFACLVIFVIAWPWKVLGLTLLIPLAAVITWASVGNDGCVELIVGWHARLKARDADKAERIRLRAKAVSAALERGLGRLPERWTHGIYLPDFEPEGYVPEKLQVDPFEELAAKVHSAKRTGEV